MKSRVLPAVLITSVLLIAAIAYLNKTALFTAFTPRLDAQAVPIVASHKNKPVPSLVETQGSSSEKPSAPLPHLLKGSAAFSTIDEASTAYDAAAVPAIAPYLYSPDKNIRAAALDGLIRLGESAASPYLREAAKTAPTPQEAEEWLKAADYLALPNWNDYRKKRIPSPPPASSSPSASP